MKLFYKYFCKLEELIVQAFVCGIVTLVFLSAVFRTLRHPINWAVDLSLLLLSWAVFLGADMALRNIGLVNVDFIIKRLPPVLRKGLEILWQVLILVFLAALAWYGVPLAIESSKRLFQTLGVSYSWATISLPVGSVLMMITTGIKLYRIIKTPAGSKG